MANWNNPTIATSYAGTSGVIDVFKDRDIDSITLISGVPTNIPIGAIKYDRPGNKFQEWDGTVFIDKVISIAGGGTGANNALSARTNLGLGTMAVQNDNNVNITGGTISGLSALTVTGTASIASLIITGNVSLPAGSIEEADIADGTILARVAGNEIISGNWTFGIGVGRAVPLINSGNAPADAAGIILQQAGLNKASWYIQGGNTIMTYDGSMIFNNIITGILALTIDPGGNSAFYGALGWGSGVLIPSSNDVALKNQSQSVTGLWNFSNIVVNNAVIFDELAASATNKAWGIIAAGSTMYYTTFNDIYEFGEVYLQVNRSGLAVTQSLLKKAVIHANDGSAFSPAYSFANEPNLGFRRSHDQIVTFCSANSDLVSFGWTGPFTPPAIAIYPVTGVIMDLGTIDVDRHFDTLYVRTIGSEFSYPSIFIKKFRYEPSPLYGPMFGDGLLSATQTCFLKITTVPPTSSYNAKGIFDVDGSAIDNDIILLMNTNSIGAGSVTIKHEDTSVPDGNRFWSPTGVDIVLVPFASIYVIRHSNRWVILKY